jgi:hypothetical protein
MTEQGSSRRTQFLLVLSPIGGQSTNGNPQPKPGTSFTGSEASLLLLTFSVSLLAVLASVLRRAKSILPEHHENAAKSHRAAAEQHGKNDHVNAALL